MSRESKIEEPRGLWHLLTVRCARSVSSGRCNSSRDPSDRRLEVANVCQCLRSPRASAHRQNGRRGVFGGRFVWAPPAPRLSGVRLRQSGLACGRRRSWARPPVVGWPSTRRPPLRANPISSSPKMAIGKAARTHARAAKGQPESRDGKASAFGFHPLPKTQSPGFCCSEQAIGTALERCRPPLVFRRRRRAGGGSDD